MESFSTAVALTAALWAATPPTAIEWSVSQENSAMRIDVVPCLCFHPPEFHPLAGKPPPAKPDLEGCPCCAAHTPGRTAIR